MTRVITHCDGDVVKTVSENGSGLAIPITELSSFMEEAAKQGVNFTDEASCATCEHDSCLLSDTLLVFCVKFPDYADWEQD